MGLLGCSEAKRENSGTNLGFPTVDNGIVRPDQLGPRKRRRRRPERQVPPRGSTVTVQPTEIDDILYNPGMGFADFHLGFGNPPLPPSQHPRPTVAYFRWSWADLEPAEGQYDFVLVDSVIAQAKAKGETLAFRIMTDYGIGSPRWLLDKGVASVKVRDGVFPEYNNPIFLDFHERLIRASGSGMRAHLTLITWISARWAAGGSGTPPAVKGWKHSVSGTTQLKLTKLRSPIGTSIIPPAHRS